MGVDEVVHVVVIGLAAGLAAEIAVAAVRGALVLSPRAPRCKRKFAPKFRLRTVGQATVLWAGPTLIN